MQVPLQILVPIPVQFQHQFHPGQAREQARARARATGNGSPRSFARGVGGGVIGLMAQVLDSETVAASFENLRQVCSTIVSFRVRACVTELVAGGGGGGGGSVVLAVWGPVVSRWVFAAHGIAVTCDMIGMTLTRARASARGPARARARACAKAQARKRARACEGARERAV